MWLRVKNGRWTMRRVVRLVTALALVVCASWLVAPQAYAADAGASNPKRGMFGWGVSLKVGIGVALQRGAAGAFGSPKRGAIEIDLDRTFSIEADFQKQSGIEEDAPSFAHASGGAVLEARHRLGESRWFVSGGAGLRVGAFAATNEIIGVPEAQNQVQGFENEYYGFPVAPQGQVSLQWWPYRGFGFDVGVEYFPAFFRGGVVHQLAHITSLTISF